MSEDLRGRFKSKPKSNQPKKASKAPDAADGIFGIWQDQRRMQAEEDKIARELSETKRKAKELKKTLRNYRYGEIKNESVKKIKKYKSKSVSRTRKIYNQVRLWSTGHKKLATGVVVLVVGGIGFVSYVQLKPGTTATLGDSDDNSSGNKQVLPTEKPGFSILFRAGKSDADFEVRRTNPEGSAASYTFIDTLAESTVPFQVTQQEVPDNFNLEKTASDFQANNIIQIDGNRVYHGFSEKAKIQSLIFIKKDRLVLISSPQKFTDDQWVGYITSLN